MRNNCGFSLLEVLLVGVVTGITALGYFTAVAAFNRNTAGLTQKMVAETYAAELPEMFRSMKPDQMKTYLTNLVETGAPCPAIPGDCNLDGKATDDDLLCLPRISHSPEVAVPTEGSLESQIVPEAYAQWLKSKESNLFATCGGPYCPLLPGDYDRDGDVDGTDFLKWQQQQECTQNCSADGNRDGHVDIQDKEIWHKHYGKVSTCGAPSEVQNHIPDPQPYRLCEVINPSYEELLKNTSGKYYYDSVAELPSSIGLPNARRSFKVQLVNMTTMQANVNKCGTRADAESAAPAADEFYVVTSEISWGEPQPQRLVLSVGIPKETASTPPVVPPVTPTTVACGGNTIMPPPPLASTAWHTFTENFSVDLNTNAADWKLNKLRANWGNTTRQLQYTCQPGVGDFYMIKPSGGGGTNETGFSCQALLVRPGFVTGPEWNASYEFSIKEADDCADSFNFLWNTDDWNPTNVVGLVDGAWWTKDIFYAFEADVYKNDGVDSDDHHFAVHRGIKYPHLPNTTYSGISNLCDNRWRRVELQYRHNVDGAGNYLADQSGKFTVKVDGTQVIDTTLSCVDYTRNNFAIHGTSGADTATIKVRNLQIDSRY